MTGQNESTEEKQAGQATPNQEVPIEEKHDVQHSNAGHVQEVVQQFPLKFQTAEQMSEYIIKRRVYDSASWRTLETEVGIPKSTLHANYNDVCAKLALQLQQQQQQQQIEQQKQALQQSSMPLPHGDRAITQQQWETLGKLDKKNIPSWKALVDQYNWELREKQERSMRGATPNPGISPSSQLGPREALAYMQTQQIMQQLQLGMMQTQKLMATMQQGPQQANAPSLFDAAKWGATFSSKVGNSSKTSNEFDLRLEELRQGHDIDMTKINWAMEKEKLQRMSEMEKWKAIENTFSPILKASGPEIQKAIRAAATRIGKSFMQPQPQQNPDLTVIRCEKCGVEVGIPKQLKPDTPVKCPSCGEVFPYTAETGSPETEKGSRLRPTYT